MCCPRKRQKTKNCWNVYSVSLKCTLCECFKIALDSCECIQPMRWQKFHSLFPTLKFPKLNVICEWQTTKRNFVASFETEKKNPRYSFNANRLAFFFCYIRSFRFGWWFLSIRECFYLWFVRFWFNGCCCCLEMYFWLVSNNHESTSTLHK